MIRFNTTAPFETQRGQFIWQLVDELETPYKRFLGLELDHIVRDNEAIIDKPAYLHIDRVYARGLQVASVGRVYLPYGQLAPQLLERHLDWLGNYNEHTEQWTRKQQTLKTLLMDARNWNDLRNMLPEPVIQPYLFNEPVFQNLPRTRPDLYAGDPTNPDYLERRAAREAVWPKLMLDRYESIGATINTYVGYRLL